MACRIAAVLMETDILSNINTWSWPRIEKTRCYKPVKCSVLDDTIYMLHIYLVTGKQVIEILKAHGWILDRINGSHHIMVKEGARSIPVPIHGSTDLGVVAKKILKQAGIQ